MGNIPDDRYGVSLQTSIFAKLHMPPEKEGFSLATESQMALSITSNLSTLM